MIFYDNSDDNNSSNNNNNNNSDNIDHNVDDVMNDNCINGKKTKQNKPDNIISFMMTMKNIKAAMTKNMKMINTMTYETKINKLKKNMFNLQGRERNVKIKTKPQHVWKLYLFWTVSARKITRII